MQLFYQPGVLHGVRYLDPEESRHCIKVLRKKQNDVINIVDGQGTFYQGLITETNPGQTQFQIIDQRQETARDYAIHLAVAPTKRAERMEWLVEKAVELGVDRISFVICEHSERQKLRIDRLRRKAVSAMKQSLKACLPRIDELVKLDDLFPLLAPDTNKFLAYLNDNTTSLAKAAKPGASYCVLIGPEGDFSEKEIHSATTIGFRMVSLGPNRLRTETAALTAVVVLHYVNW